MLASALSETTPAAVVSDDIRLDHESLDVYRVAVELDALVTGVGRKAARGHGWLVDQLSRASGSAVLNIAEGCGREGADRARHLRIAKGSVLELDAALTLLVHRAGCDIDARVQARELTVRVVAMVARLIRVSR